MPNLPFDMSQNAIEILAQHVVSGLNAFAQKIGVQDDEPMLERLRRGEYRLAPSSLSEINPLFEEGVSRLIELDQSIAKIEDAMQRLKRTRTCFEGSLTIAASLFAPIRRVPEDVLVEILSLYIEDQEEYSFSLTTYDTASGNLAPSIRSATLHLSHVCSFWRRIISNRPRLWSSLNLDMAGLVRGIQAARVLSIVSEHLSRSIPVPLRLGISLYDAYNNSSSVHAFDILSRHAARCESLSLTVFQEQSMSHFLHQLQSRTAVLSSLKHLNFGYGPDDISLAVLVRGAKLRTLNALALDLSWSNFRPCNFSSLQELHIFGLRGAPLGRFLECMPSLDSLELGSLTSGFTLDKAATELADSPVRPSNLRHLRIRSNKDCPAEAWRTLCVPHLTSLWTYFAKYPKSSVEEISSCFFRSRTVLQKLNLYAHFDNEEVLDFVRSQPSIDELTLEYYQSRSEGTVSLKDVLSYLTLSQLEDPQNTALVPNLRRLIIEIFYPDYSFQTLPTLARDISEMVKSRASAGDRPPGDAGLQAFHLDFFAQDCVQDLFSEIRVLLAPLVTSGLQLRLDTC